MSKHQSYLPLVNGCMHGHSYLFTRFSPDGCLNNLCALASTNTTVDKTLGHLYRYSYNRYLEECVYI